MKHHANHAATTRPPTGGVFSLRMSFSDDYPNKPVGAAGAAEPAWPAPLLPIPHCRAR